MAVVDSGGVVTGEVEAVPVVDGVVGAEVVGVDSAGVVGSVGRDVVGDVGSEVVGVLVGAIVEGVVVVGWLDTGALGPPPLAGSGVGRTSR